MVESKHQWKAWLYLSPAIILLLIFTVWPIINTLFMAFSEGYTAMGNVAGETFKFGIGNFTKVLLKFPDFKECLINTMLLCFATVPLSTFLALLIAVCLNSIRPLKRLLQTIFFLPYVTNSIAVGMVFAAMFNIVGTFLGSESQIVTSAGLVNYFIDITGFGNIIEWLLVNHPETIKWLTTTYPISWINDGSTYMANMIVMIVYIVWNALPFKILILLGGLQSVNKQYYDAAKVDGTSRTRVFTRITIPLLSPMLAYVIITGFIGGFKEYSSIVGIFGENMGPPHDPYRLNTMVGLIYKELPFNRYGTVSAAALILFLIIFAVTMVNLWVSKKKVHY